MNLFLQKHKKCEAILLRMLQKALALTIKLKLDWILIKNTFTEHIDTQIPTIFPTILTCRILSESADCIKTTHTALNKRILNITREFVELIEQEKSTYDSWNYWKTNSKEYATQPYPDDLDDTCNGHFIFQIQEHAVVTTYDLHNTKTPKYFDSKKIFNFTNQLLQSERKHKTGTGYNTWIQSFELQSMEDIDPVVQVILYKVLSKLKSVPDGFKSFLLDKISRLPVELWGSKYYHSKLYVLSELSSLPLLEIASSESISNTHKSLTDSYLTMADIDKRMKSNTYDQLFRTQIEIQLDIFDISTLSGIIKALKIVFLPLRSIKTEPIFVESIRKEKIQYRYSRDVMIAVYIKLLCSLLQYTILKNSASTNNRTMELRDLCFEKTIIEIKKMSYTQADFDNLIRQTFKGMNTLKSIHTELYDFAHNIKNYRPNLDAYLQPVYLLTLCGWISYTMYDNILDKESDMGYISHANHYNQLMMYQIYLQLRYNKKSEYIWETIHEILTELHLSQQNTTGTEKPSSKSIGHCIGPLLIFTTLIPRWKKSDISLLIEHYRYYLSLKQISDDAHDWKEDIEAGRETYITKRLKSIGKSQKSDLSDMDWYIHVFSTSVLRDTYNDMKMQTQKAVTALLQIEDHFSRKYILKRTRDTEKYVLGIEQAIQDIELYNLFKPLPKPSNL